MKEIIFTSLLVAALMLGGAAYETLRSLSNAPGVAEPLSIMVYYIMGSFWGGFGIFLVRQEKVKTSD
ncbi:MAG: hypothetical protein WC456_04250 [Patescibacteria group bacterium]